MVWVIELWRTSLYCSSIKRKEKEAKEILGDKVYYHLDKSILELLDRGTFLELMTMRYGDMVYTGTIDRLVGINKDKAEDKLSIPPFTGQTYQEIFGVPQKDAYWHLFTMMLHAMYFYVLTINNWTIHHSKLM